MSYGLAVHNGTAQKPPLQKKQLTVQTTPSTNHLPKRFRMRAKQWKKMHIFDPSPPAPPDNAGTIGISWDLTEGSAGPTPRCPRGGAGCLQLSCLQLSPLLLLYAPTQKDNCTPHFDPIGDAKRDFCACNYLFSEIIAGTQNCLSPSILPAIISRLEIIAGKTF